MCETEMNGKALNIQCFEQKKVRVIIDLGRF